MAAFEMLKDRLADDDEAKLPSDDVLLSICESAKNIIMSRRYPYGNWPDEIEQRYVDLQVRIALAMVDKIGAEYETSHSENGITRNWGSEDIPASLLFEITPKVGGLS